MKTFGILVKNVIYHLITKETYIDIFNLIMKAFGIQVMNVTNVLSIGVKKQHEIALQAILNGMEK